MTTDEIAQRRTGLVRELRDLGVIHSPSIDRAFRVVPRHLFIPHVTIDDAYADRAIPVKLEDGVAISSASQPAMIAEMLEQLALRPAERVLEIGAGTGYNAALLAELVGPAGLVVTIDIDDDLVEGARRHLDEAGYRDVRTRCADGTDGDPDDAPFDAIIAAVALADVPVSWFDQLRVGGRLVMPLALRSVQKVIGFERKPSSFASRSIVDGAFMWLRGRWASPDLGPIALSEPTTTLRVIDATAVDVLAVARALDEPAVDVVPIRHLSVLDVWEGFSFWLALHDDAFCRLTAPNIMAGTSCFGQASTLGCCSGRELVVFAPRGDDRGIVLRRFGPDEGGVERLQRAIADWDDVGRPDNATFRIEVVPTRLAAARVPDETRVVVELPSATAFVRWRSWR